MVWTRSKRSVRVVSSNRMPEAMRAVVCHFFDRKVTLFDVNFLQKVNLFDDEIGLDLVLFLNKKSIQIEAKIGRKNGDYQEEMCSF